MPYRGGKLADLAPPLEASVDRFSRRAAEQVGEDLRRRVRRHTPIAKPGAPEIVASYGSTDAWIRARGGRRPGTLHDSWRVGDVDVRIGAGGKVYRVPVFTLDPVGPHVEWDTMPHIIVPVRARALTIPTKGGMLFAQLVRHPGTRGAHMMSRALLEVSASWDRIVRREWQQETRQLWRLGRAA